MDAKTGLVPRDSVPEDCRWHLGDLYAADADWQKDLDALESRLAGYAAHKGKLGESPASLKACLEFDMNVSRKLEAIYTYAHLRNDEDKTNTFYQGNFEKATRLATLASQARSFMASEIMAIPEERMNAFLKDKELEFYRYHLEKILRYREHTLSEKEEALLAASEDMARVSQEVFGMLNNADLKLGSIRDGSGAEIQITQGNFQSLLQNYDRNVRKAAFETFYAEYRDHQHTLAMLLSSSVKKDTFYARARGFPSVREQELFADNISIAVYDTLVSTVRENLQSLYKYFSLRKRILGLDELRVYDCSLPLAKDIRWHLPYPEAVDIIAESLEPLGAEYVAILKRGLLAERWVDRYENKGKRSGAYSSGCHDSRPYILMNYREDDINSLYTLAHEAGHSLHSYYSRKQQPYLYSGYTIFVAEVASTFNEALMTRYLLDRHAGKDMQVYLVCREIDNIRGTLFRQTMFAEYERRIHDMSERGESLTLETCKSVYRELLQLYFGPETVLNEELLLECFRIPHFYHSFYVYKYATGISAAYCLADRVINGGKKERKDYLDFLCAGGTKFPLDLLKDAGVDMMSPQPILKAMQKFSALVDRLESLMN